MSSEGKIILSINETKKFIGETIDNPLEEIIMQDSVLCLVSAINGESFFCENGTIDYILGVYSVADFIFSSMGIEVSDDPFRYASPERRIELENDLRERMTEDEDE